MAGWLPASLTSGFLSCLLQIGRWICGQVAAGYGSECCFRVWSGHFPSVYSVCHVWLRNSTPRYFYPRETKTQALRKTYPRVYSAWLTIVLKMEAIGTPINWWMDNQNVVCPQNRILFSDKKDWIIDACDTMDVLRKHHAKGRKPDTEGCISDDFTYMKCPE